MSIETIISAERDRYVAHFEAVAEEMSATKAQYAREVLISVDTDTLSYPYRFIRADLMENSADGTPQVYEIWLDPLQDSEATGFQLGPVTIEIYPFTWCEAQIAFDRQLPDLAKLEALLTSWLDVADTRSTNRAANAIHSVTPVETNGRLWYLTIDFGTAPADTMLDLLDFLANEGRSDRIVITSFPRGKDEIGVSRFGKASKP